MKNIAVKDGSKPSLPFDSESNGFGEQQMGTPQGSTHSSSVLGGGAGIKEILSGQG